MSRKRVREVERDRWRLEIKRERGGEIKRERSRKRERGR